MTQEKITRQQIDEARKRFIEENMLLSPIEVAGILRISVRSVYTLIDEGHLKKVNGHANAGKTRIRATVVRQYREKIEN